MSIYSYEGDHYLWNCNCDKAVNKLVRSGNVVHLRLEEPCDDCLKTYREFTLGSLEGR